MVKNRLHAEEHSGWPIKSTIRRIKDRINYLNKQIELVEKELKAIVLQDKYVSKKVKQITTTPGLAFISVVTVIAETNGFSNISSIKQLNSYAGYDVRIKESGNWKGRSSNPRSRN